MKILSIISLIQSVAVVTGFTYQYRLQAIRKSLLGVEEVKVDVNNLVTQVIF